MFQYQTFELKKTPRIFRSYLKQPLKHVQLQLDGLQFLPLYDLSFAGFVGPSHPQFHKMKKGVAKTFNLKMEIVEEKTQFKAVFFGEKDGQVFFFIDPLEKEKRIFLNQVVKDYLIQFNLADVSPFSVNPETLHHFHGPFETDFVILKNNRFIIAYDGIIFRGGPDGVHIFPSVFYLNSNEFYEDAWLPHKKSHPISLGQSWRERVLKLVEKLPIESTRKDDLKIKVGQL